MNTGQHDASGVGGGLGILMDGDFAPPKHSADYEAKPLPAVPPQTSFSIPDMKAIVRMTKRLSGTKQYVVDWDSHADNITIAAAVRSGTPRSRSLPVNNASSIPTEPSNEILSPQPRHSRQKILRLTGNLSPSMSLASFEPSQHNSQHKVKQLTGLDLGSSSSSEDRADSPLLPFQDEISPVSPTSSGYSVEGLEATISEPESDASEYTLHSDTDVMATRLTVPSSGAPASRSPSAAPTSPTTRVRLSSFAMRDTDAASQQPIDFKAHYRYISNDSSDFTSHQRQSSNASSWASSRKSSVTVVRLSASGSDTFKLSPRTSLCATDTVDVDAEPPSPSLKKRSLIWDPRPMENSTAEGGQYPNSPSPSPPPPAQCSTCSEKCKTVSPWDRRASSSGYIPTPLEPDGEFPLKPSKFTQPQWTPHPPPPPPPPSAVSSSALDGDSDDGKRTSFLGKVFRGGGGANSKRDSCKPTLPSPFGEENSASTVSLPSSGAGGGVGVRTIHYAPPPPIPDSLPPRSQGRDAPWLSAEGGRGGGGAAGGGGGGGGGAFDSARGGARPMSAGPGLFQRAKQSVGFRSRSGKRSVLKGKIRTIEA
jgi:hypothetical protein